MKADRRPRLRLTGRLFLLIVLALIFSVGVSCFVDAESWEKVATDLVMPLGLTWLLLSASVLSAFRRGAYRQFVLLFSGWLLVFLGGNGALAGYFAKAVESQFYSQEFLHGEPFDLVVLLGGAANSSPNGGVQVNGSGDRVVLVARMYHRKLVKRILCAGAGDDGKRMEEIEQPLTTGECSRQILVDLGVDPSVIGLLGGRNTSEEFARIKAVMNDDDRIGIVTSAWHMPRAMRLARVLNIDAEPLPADYRSSPRNSSRSEGASIRCWIPNQEALSINTRILREWLARVVGR